MANRYAKPAIIPGCVSYNPEDKQRELVMMIDTREAHRFYLLVKERMEAMGMPGKVQTCPELHIGDVMWVVKGTETRKMGEALEPEMYGYVCEVKKAADWKAGITDGRHKEQKGRFFNVESDHTKMIFLVEGNLLASQYGVSNESVMGSIANTVLRDECRFVGVQNTQAIADFLVQLHFKLEFMNDAKINRQLTYSHYIQASAKKKDVREEHLLQHILINHVQGVSADIAETIANRYRTFADLMSAFLTNRSGTASGIANMVVMRATKDNTPFDHAKAKRIGVATTMAIVKTLGIISICESLKASATRPPDDDADEEEEDEDAEDGDDDDDDFKDVDKNNNSNAKEREKAAVARQDEALRKMLKSSIDRENRQKRSQASEGKKRARPPLAPKTKPKQPDSDPEDDDYNEDDERHRKTMKSSSNNFAKYNFNE